MKRNGSITNFFRPFTEPRNTRALSEERRDRGSSFPALSVLDSSRWPRWPSIDETKEHLATPTALRREIASPTPPPETNPTHSAPPSRSQTDPSLPQDEMPNQNTRSIDPGSSFNSSFSSLPPQQSQSSTASKRMLKDGVQLVRTSDSEEEDSDSELEDLSTILNKKRRATAALADVKPVMMPKRDDARSTYDLRSHFKRVPPRREFKSIVPPRQKHRISLSDIVAQREKGLDAEARVLEAQRKAQEAEKAAEESKEQGRLTKDGLSAALGDAEGGQRTFEALRRTEALETNQVWQFFEASSDQITSRSAKFPARCLSQEGWQRRLIDPSTRDTALTSGLVRSRIYKQRLPDEVLLWMIDDLCHNRKEDLADAYLGVFESSTPQMRKLLTRETLSALFQKLGARKEAASILVEQPEILPTEVYPYAPKIPFPHGARRLLELLTGAAPCLETDAVEYSLEVLIRLGFDDSIQQDGYIQGKCQEAISVLIDSLSVQDEPEVLRRVSQTLFKNFRNHGPRDDIFVNHVLQARLIQSLPSTTRREATFQRRLALAFFLDSPKPLKLSLTASGIVPAILQSLTHNPLYRFGRGTDYTDVTAAFTLLDIAVDCGFSDRAFVQTLRNIDRRTRDTAARQLRDAARAAEDEFNRGVDVLTATIRRIMGQIRGSGTESVRMSEAKGAMERLIYRLETSVRTREKSGTDIFANDIGRSAGLMESWVGGGGAASGRGGGKGGGGVEEVDGDAADKKEHGDVEREPDGQGADEVAAEVKQDVEVVEEDVDDDLEQEVERT